MKRYISYCRAKVWNDIQRTKGKANSFSFPINQCAPVLSPEAEDSLRTHYVKIRSEHRVRCRESRSASTVPITVRQLQAIVRISEALAKMELKTEVMDYHMAEVCFFPLNFVLVMGLIPNVTRTLGSSSVSSFDIECCQHGGHGRRRSEQRACQRDPTRRRTNPTSHPHRRCCRNSPIH